MQYSIKGVQNYIVNIISSNSGKNIVEKLAQTQKKK
jgi:hypothetical protein